MAEPVNQLETVMRYHQETKHHFNRYARALGSLDWANQPNPFRQTTAIGFSLENAGRVVLEICDVNGRTITRLLDGLRPAGASRIAWDGTDARGRPVSPGVYYCRLRAGADERVRGMLSIR